MAVVYHRAERDVEPIEARPTLLPFVLSLLTLSLSCLPLVGRDRFYTPPPPGSNLRDCKCARIETKASIHNPLREAPTVRNGQTTVGQDVCDICPA